MSNFTNQWCDDSVARVTRCNGGESWPSIEAIRTAVTAILTSSMRGHADGELNAAILKHIPEDRRPSDVVQFLPTTRAAILAECGKSKIAELLNALDGGVRASRGRHAGQPWHGAAEELEGQLVASAMAFEARKLLDWNNAARQ